MGMERWMWREKEDAKVVIGSLEIISYFEFLVSAPPSPSLDLPTPTLASISSMSAFESCMGCCDGGY
jgi:hypothetical protein